MSAWRMTAVIVARQAAMYFYSSQYLYMQESNISVSNILPGLQEKEIRLLAHVVKETSNLITITNARQQIVWTNDAFQKISGYTLEEVLNKNPRHLFAGREKDEKEVERMKAAIRKGVGIEGEILNYGKDGKKFWVHYNIHPVKDSNGAITHYFSVQSDITETKNLQDMVSRQKIDRQKAITHAAMCGQEKERNELGRELHDNINQILVSAKLMLDCSLASPADAPTYVKSAYEQVSLAIQEIRSFSHRLVSPRFNETSLKSALTKTLTGLGLQEMSTLRIARSAEQLVPGDVKLTIFRICQEQLNNIVKHSKANWISIQLTVKNQTLRLKIEDNGVGFDTRLGKKGIGLMNIFNRVESHNGVVDVVSSPGGGCTLQLSIPLD
jgi:two-component system sensor histidine kinase UhpB